MSRFLFTVFMSFCLGFSAQAHSADAAAKNNPAPAVEAVQSEDYTITIKDKAFSPADLTVPANQKVKITIINEDTAPAEFESHELHREKVVPGKGKVVLSVGPLKPGTYKYMNDFKQDATGTITAK